MHHLRRFVALLAAGVLITLGVLLAQPSQVEAQQDVAFTLVYSEQDDRSNAQPLDGATIDAGEGIAVYFASPIDLDWVVFTSGGLVDNVDLVAPYDLLGSADDGSAILTSFPAGTQSLTAWFPDDGGISGITATFDLEPACSTILEIATNPEAPFSTLVTAATLASEAGEFDFVAELDNPNVDITLFAPTDAAFEALGDALDDVLADPAGLLTQVLAYHALDSAQSSGALLEAGNAITVQGQEVNVAANEGGVFINESLVLTADVQACNGIVHVIDAVLLPDLGPECSTILEIATEPDAPFSTLVTAVTLASEAGEIDFVSAIADPDFDLTVFAPTDAAFAALGDALGDVIADPGGLLTDVLAYHVLGSGESADALIEAGSATTLQGQDVTISQDEFGVLINNAGVVTADIEACNGIVHVIDTVLLPDLGGGGGDPLVDGNVIALRNVQRDQFLDADPGAVNLGAFNGIDNEWTLDAVGDGTWRLINGQFPTYLDADTASKGYDVNLNNSPNGFGVEWEIVPVTEPSVGYTLRAVDLNRYLDGDSDGDVDTSSSVNFDDVWEITVIIEGGLDGPIDFNEPN